MLFLEQIGKTLSQLRSELNKTSLTQLNYLATKCADYWNALDLLTPIAMLSFVGAYFSDNLGIARTTGAVADWAKNASNVYAQKDLLVRACSAEALQPVR